MSIAEINQIKKDLQTDRIFDVIGTFLRVENLNPEDVLREAAVNPRRAEDFLDKVERLTAEELKKFEATTAVALARRNLDLASLNRRTQLHEDLRLMPEYVQDLPCNGRRLIARSEGIVGTFVAGTQVYDHQTYTGALPGRVLRSYE